MGMLGAVIEFCAVASGLRGLWPAVCEDCLRTYEADLCPLCGRAIRADFLQDLSHGLARRLKKRLGYLNVCGSHSPRGKKESCPSVLLQISFAQHTTQGKVNMFFIDLHRHEAKHHHWLLTTTRPVSFRWLICKAWLQVQTAEKSISSGNAEYPARKDQFSAQVIMHFSSLMYSLHEASDGT